MTMVKFLLIIVVHFYKKQTFDILKTYACMQIKKIGFCMTSIGDVASRACTKYHKLLIARQNFETLWLAIDHYSVTKLLKSSIIRRKVHFAFKFAQRKSIIRH